jgi:hypothetical protein
VIATLEVELPFKYRSLIDRIIANSVLSEESFYNGTPCWIWTGNTTVNEGGKHYPRMTRRFSRGPRKGKVNKEFVHRVIVKGIKGRRLSKRMVAKHLCNNSLCVNPDHITGGSQASNIQQCVKDGRHVSGFKKNQEAA